MAIHFFSHGISFRVRKKNSVQKLLARLIQKEKKAAGNISLIFCSDNFLLDLNKKFLGHHTLTDIITFQYPGKELSADIFISVPRVRENANKFKVVFEKELLRVMVHGVLHLCGYKDKTPAQKKKIRKMEDHYLLLGKNS